MNAAQRSVLRRANALMVWLYRSTGGRLMGSAKGAPVLLLTAPGRRTLVPHTVPLAYMERRGSWVVTGSGGGMKNHPQWIANLRHSGRATIQIGRERQQVSAVVTQGAERDALWREVIEWKPFFQDYERKSGRIIPVAVLTPLGAGTN
ncbi:MAG: nitroreductase/quinone reductase family protein [Ornithinibacter sp.]